MKVACDVKGTINGPKKKQVLKMLDIFAKAGYEITVWSNLYSYATEAVQDNNLRAQTSSKYSKTDWQCEGDESKFFNFAIEDDRQQTYLAAKKFIWVDEIPEDLVQVEMFVKELLDGQ